MCVFMLNELEKKVAAFIKRNNLFSEKEKILLGVSGGADSTALLYILSALKNEGVLNHPFHCAHINHQLRGAEAEGDEEFTIKKSGELGIPVASERINVKIFSQTKGLSIETAARNLRISALMRIANANSCSCIATAHQMDDNAETVLGRLGRGTGFRGLAGIWPVKTFPGNIRFVRPLLGIARSGIIKYLKDKNISWREDRTNKDCAYRRNFIRHKLMPALQMESSDSVSANLFKLSESALRFYKLVCKNADKIWPCACDIEDGQVGLKVDVFNAQPIPVKIQMVRKSLSAISSPERNLTEEHYRKILHLADTKQSGKTITLPAGYRVRREYNNLIFVAEEKEAEKKKEKPKEKRIAVPGKTRFDDFYIETEILQSKDADLEDFKKRKSPYIEWFAFEKIKPPLTVRFRKAGDRFHPLSLGKGKKVGKFLTAQKVPRNLREEILILEDAQEIIWAVPLRASENTKITEGTTKLLQIKISSVIQTDKKQDTENIS